MLHTGVQTLIILQFLRGSVCQDFQKSGENTALHANVTAQSLSIVDCFTEAINMSWQFSEEHDLNMSYFQDFTHHLCDRNSWHILQCYNPLMDNLRKVEYLVNESHHEEAEFYNTELFRTNDVEHYEKATELQRQATQVMEDLIHQIRRIKEEAEARNEFRILADNCSLKLLDMNTLVNESLQYTLEYNEMRIKMEISRFRTYTLRYYFLPFVVVVFTFGMLGNGLLLLIFVRHPKSRMGPNVMLVNLAVSDSLFLLVNIATDYCKMLWGFPFGTKACYVYNFVLTLITVASVYSMTILSFSRYVAVTAKPGSSSKTLLTSMPVMLTTVWILSAIIAIPDALTSKMVHFTSHTADCSADNILSNITCDFIFISFLPLTAITCFYIAASRRLRKSARMMPGQAIGQEKVKMARERGAKILPGLIIVFAITFLPFYTFWVIVIVLAVDVEESLISHTLYFVVYFLFNLNSALNPVALYLTSGMFRNYINNYITLGMAKKQNSPGSPDKSYTISSKL